MKERLKKEQSRRLRMIPKFELNAKNKITATGALAISILRYSFGIINWKLCETEQDRQCTYNVTMRRVCESLLQWKSNTYYIYVCVRVCARAWVPMRVGVCMRVRACTPANPACNAYAPYCTRWFKYDRDYLCVNKSQFVPVIFEPPCT
jgi:hypothetical protein